MHCTISGKSFSAIYGSVSKGRRAQEAGRISSAAIKTGRKTEVLTDNRRTEAVVDGSEAEDSREINVFISLQR